MQLDATGHDIQENNYGSEGSRFNSWRVHQSNQGLRIFHDSERRFSLTGFCQSEAKPHWNSPLYFIIRRTTVPEFLDRRVVYLTGGVSLADRLTAPHVVNDPSQIVDQIVVVGSKRVTENVLTPLEIRALTLLRPTTLLLV